jgi:hypothetical protein
MNQQQAQKLAQQVNPTCMNGHNDWVYNNDLYCDIKRAGAMCSNHDNNNIKGDAMCCNSKACPSDDCWYCFACAWWGQ